MNRLIKILLSATVIAFSSCNKCEYASYEFYENGNENPSHIMQLLLYAVTERKIELIVSDYKNKELWDFTKGDEIIFNNYLTIEFDEENEVPDLQETFFSKELTDSELNFFLNKWIKTITIHNSDNSLTAELTPNQSEQFRDTMNCLYKKDRKKYQDLIE